MSSGPGLTGALLDSPRKLVLLLLFSFESDILEIALREQQDVVDKIFIVESTVTHKAVSCALISRLWCPIRLLTYFTEA